MRRSRWSPTANPAREIDDTKLAFDVTALTGTAAITFASSNAAGATLEVGDLQLDTVQLAGADLAYTADPAKKTIDLALAPSGEPLTVDIAFHYKTHMGFAGASAAGYTFLWPYFCGNLFPCHSRPDDGMTMTLDVTGVPAGKTAVFPPTIAEAPSYQLAWSIDDYTELPLGTTTAGTAVSVWYRPNELTAAMTGTQNLVAVFDWYEKTLGPYRFGSKVGTISVKWGAGAYGGMEHHPRWHVSSSSLDSQETNVHEAAHGWFGDGIRIGCWEDFVLSEGTVSYLAARVARGGRADRRRDNLAELHRRAQFDPRDRPRVAAVVRRGRHPQGQPVHQRAVHARRVLLSCGRAEDLARARRPGARRVLRGPRRQARAHGGHARHAEDGDRLRPDGVRGDVAHVADQACAGPLPVAVHTTRLCGLVPNGLSAVPSTAAR